MLSVRTPALLRVAEAVTFFGEATTVVALAAVIGLWLISSKDHRLYVAGFVVSLFGATASAYVLKLLIARPRPVAPLPALTETTFSFPSYHAVAAVAFYGFVAFVLCRLYPERKRTVCTLAILIMLALGASRLYLGVHFPTDVLGGYALGALWLWLGVWVTKKLSAD